MRLKWIIVACCIALTLLAVSCKTGSGSKMISEQQVGRDEFGNVWVARLFENDCDKDRHPGDVAMLTPQGVTDVQVQAVASAQDTSLFAAAVKIQKQRILFTIGLVFVCRLVSMVPTPGVDWHELERQLEHIRENTTAGGGLMGWFDVFSGGAMSHCSVGLSCRTRLEPSGKWGGSALSFARIPPTVSSRFLSGFRCGSSSRSCSPQSSASCSIL